MSIVNEISLSDVLPLDELTLMRIFYWTFRSHNFTLLELILNDLKSVKTLTKTKSIRTVLSEKQLRLGQAKITLENRFEEDDRSGRRDLTINWLNELEITFEAKRGSLPAHGEADGSTPNGDPYNQIKVYIEQSRRNYPNAYLISITAEEDDLKKLNQNLSVLCSEKIMDIYWISWENIQEIIDKQQKDIRESLRLNNIQDLIDEGQLSYYVKLQELNRVIDKIVYPYKTDIITRGILEIFRRDWQGDSTTERHQLEYLIVHHFHKRIKETFKLDYVKPSGSIDEIISYERTPVRRLWIGFWESDKRQANSTERSPNLLVEYSHGLVHLAIFHGDSIDTYRTFLDSMHVSQIKELYHLLTNVDANIEILTQAFDRRARIQYGIGDVYKTKPLPTQEISEEELHNMIQSLQQQESELAREQQDRRIKGSFRISIDLKDIYSETILDHLEEAFHQLFPVYQFLLYQSGLKKYIKDQPD